MEQKIKLNIMAEPVKVNDKSRGIDTAPKLTDKDRGIDTAPELSVEKWFDDHENETFGRINRIYDKSEEWKRQNVGNEKNNPYDKELVHEIQRLYAIQDLLIKRFAPIVGENGIETPIKGVSERPITNQSYKNFINDRRIAEDVKLNAKKAAREEYTKSIDPNYSED